MPELKVIKKSKHKPSVGDIFVFQLKEGSFQWGRVISVTAEVGGFDNCILIYLYKVETDCMEEIPNIDKSDILLAPIATNELPWKRGYFKHIANRSISQADVLDVHCFKDVFFERFMDDKGNQLDGPFEPYGIYGLDSYGSIGERLDEVC